jgi:uncharacterized membrane protein
LWTSVFGYSELAIRLPSVIFAVATLVLVYKIVLKILPKNTFVALLAASLLATSQLHIYYSQEARMYSMVTLLSSLAIYSFLEILGDSKKLIAWVGFSL